MSFSGLPEHPDFDGERVCIGLIASRDLSRGTAALAPGKPVGKRAELPLEHQRQGHRGAGFSAWEPQLPDGSGDQADQRLAVGLLGGHHPGRV